MESGGGGQGGTQHSTVQHGNSTATTEHEIVLFERVLIETRTAEVQYYWQDRVTGEASELKIATAT